MALKSFFSALTQVDSSRPRFSPMTLPNTPRRRKPLLQSPRSSASQQLITSRSPLRAPSWFVLAPPFDFLYPKNPTSRAVSPPHLLTTFKLTHGILVRFLPANGTSFSVAVCVPTSCSSILPSRSLPKPRNSLPTCSRVQDMRWV